MVHIYFIGSGSMLLEQLQNSSGVSSDYSLLALITKRRLYGPT